MVQDVLAEAQNSRGPTAVTSDELKPVSACDNVKLVLLELGDVKHVHSKVKNSRWCMTTACTMTGIRHQHCLAVQHCAAAKLASSHMSRRSCLMATAPSFVRTASLPVGFNLHPQH